MGTRIHGWERASTDSVLARRFVRTLFEGDADGVAGLVAENCVSHWTGHEDATGGCVTHLEGAMQMVDSAGVELESVEAAVSDGRIDACVTTSGQDGVAVAPDAEDVAGPNSECETVPFASVRVEDDRIVEVWLHVEEFGTDAGRPLGTLVRRVSSWLSAD